MIETHGNSITFKPSPLKNAFGAAACLVFGVTFILVSGVGLYALIFLAGFVFCAINAFGIASYITLDDSGLEYRHFFVLRNYLWSDLEDFGLREIRQKGIVTNRLITFNRKDKKNTVMGKTSIALAGGTESMPVFGNHKDLMRVIQTLHRQASASCT